MGDRIWWLTLLRGVLAVLLGLLLILWPQKSAEAVIMLIGAFALVTGLIGAINAGGTRHPAWGFGLVAGIVTVLLGFVALSYPDLAATAIVYIIAAWALLFGLVEVAAGISLSAAGAIGPLTLGIGLISIVLALVLFAVPEVGIVAAALLIGIYFLTTGGLTIYHAIEVRRRVHRVEVL